MIAERIGKLRALLTEWELDGIYVSSPENRAYFSGFTGSNGHAFVTASEAALITDSRYTEQASEQAEGWRVVTHGLDAMATIQAEAAQLRASRIGYETTKLTDAEASRLRTKLPEIEWLPMEDFGVSLRAVKDERELGYIRQAAGMADRAILKLMPKLAFGMTERDIQAELEYLLAKEGSEAPAFATIVVSGTRTSLPHGTATDKPIAPGEMIVIDFGATYKGYRSDITRTLWVGVPNPDLFHLFHVVLRAQEAALAAIKPGIIAGDLDRAHRLVFEEEGMEAYALRGLGHGVGLHIHELPRVVIGSTERIVPGMVFTVEPGLYVPGVGGVRMEDMVSVTADGCEVLTRTPKVLQVHEFATVTEGGGKR